MNGKDGTGERMFRVAIVGTGGIASIHARALSELSDRVQLVAAVDIDEDRAKRFASEWGIGSTYPSLGSMLADTALDVVHICTPPRSHFPLALEALESNVSVLIEKPPTLTLADAAELQEAERRSSAHAAVVFQHRFGSAAIGLKELIEGGLLGRPLAATCDTLWYRDAEYYSVAWRGSWEEEGGGPTMGHGIHQFDLLLSLLGPWKRMAAFAERLILPVETEDISAAVVQFENGAIGTIVNSVLSVRETSSLRFDFEFATVELNHLYGYSDEDWTFTPRPGHEHLEVLWRTSLRGVPSGHLAQFRRFYQALASGAEPPVSLSEAGRTLAFAAGIYASAFGNRIVTPDDVAPGSLFWQSMNGGAPSRGDDGPGR